MMKRGLVVALVIVVVIAGFSAWKANAQGPDGNDVPPCGQYYGPGMMRGGHMMGGWNAPEDCPYADGAWTDPGMMDGWNWDDCPFADSEWSGRGLMRGHGMMGGWNTPEDCPFADEMWGAAAGDDVEMTLTTDDARAAAQVYLDEIYPGLTVDEEAWTVNGFFMLHILEDGQLVGMLSVNGTTGDIRLHHQPWSRSPQDV
ncbi:hypothetical protein [Aggregatilinea lenta]|uniref:hypothetical protein n=1 Tax=Aggregatilinea lenta TaxID=913108 RepID=UPI000E5A1F59|nr:hypothetical protein [Aggregatilinea lenta]